MDQERSVQKEKATVRKLIRLYCGAHHQTSKNELCEQCQIIYDYASERIDNCLFGFNKPTCQNCPVHCYSKDRKGEIKKIMRYSGPRMIYKHPLASINHFINKAVDKRKYSDYLSQKKKTSQ